MTVWAVQILDKIKEKSRRTKLKVWSVTRVVTFQWGSDSCFPIMLFCMIETLVGSVHSVDGFLCRLVDSGADGGSVNIHFKCI